MSLSGHCALIIGASRGIGRAVAIGLAKEGVSLSLTARDQKTLDGVAEECKKAAPEGSKIQVFSHVFDASDYKKLKVVIDESAKLLGRISILFCNAGVNRRRKAYEADPTIWEQVVSVNMISPMYATAYCIPHLLKSVQETDKDSVIIYNSSIAVRNGWGDQGLASYYGSKQGISGFASCVRLDLLGKRVKVSCINLGLVNTDLGNRPRPGFKLLPDQMIQPEDAVEAVLYIIRSKKTVVPFNLDLYTSFITTTRIEDSKEAQTRKENKQGQSENQKASRL